VNSASPLYHRHRLPPANISHAVYLYFRFALRYRDVEELLAVRGIAVLYETIRRGCLNFGHRFAAEVGHRRPHPRDRWHLDEIYLRIGGKAWHLWRAVDAEGLVLDILLQERRNQEAAEAFLRRLLEGQPAEPRVIVTDKLASYIPAVKQVFPQAEHRRHKGINNRVENSHQPTRHRERARRRFKSPGHTQRFLEPFGPIREHFWPRRQRLAGAQCRVILQERCTAWAEITGTTA
jgi:putative transposase